jgi:hypothetical protein
MDAQIKAFGKTPAFADREEHITIVRSEDSRFEISILPAEKSCHNFEQSSNKHNCTEWKLGSKHSAKHQHSQIEKRTLRSEDSRFEISIIPAEKPFHHDNFERIISKQNYFAEWKLRSTNSAKYLYSAFHAYGGGAHLVRALLRTLSVRYVEGPGSSESMIRLVAGAELGDSSSRT